MSLSMTLGPKEPCDFCGKIAILCPYGPNDEMICYECGMKDAATTRKKAMARLSGLPPERAARLVDGAVLAQPDIEHICTDCGDCEVSPWVKESKALEHRGICAQCEQPSKSLRPYGEDGANICSDCGFINGDITKERIAKHHGLVKRTVH